MFLILQNVLVKGHPFANAQKAHIQCGMGSICFGVFYGMVILNEHTSCLLMKMRAQSDAASVKKF